MKIVLLESLAVSEEKVAALAAPLIAAGHSFVAYTDGARDVDLLIERAKDADILMVASSPLPAEVVDACKNLKLISVAFTEWTTCRWRFAGREGFWSPTVRAIPTRAWPSWSLGW